MFSHDEYVNCNVLIGWFCCHYVEHCRDLYPSAIRKQCPRSADRYFLRDAFWCTMISPHVSSLCFLRCGLSSSCPFMLASETSKHVEDHRRLWQKLAGKLVSYKDEWCIMVLLLFVFVDIWHVSVRTMLEKCHTDLVLCCAISLFEDFIRMFLQCFLFRAVHRNPLQLGDQHGWSHRSTHSLLWRCWQCSNWALCM